jgi:iron(III) transport system substrate-binding protein
MSVRPGATRKLAIAGAAIAALALSACGGAPQEPGASGGGDKAETAAQAYERFAAMEEPARTKALVKAAKKEGTLNIYGTDDMEKLGALFSEKYGIKIKAYEADTDDVATRIAQEADGGRHIADVLNSSDVLANQLEEKGLLGSYESDIREEVPAEGKSDTWTGYRRQPFIVAYNTKKVDPGDIPDDIFGFADPKWKGKISMELGDYDWYMGMVMHYLDEGMSREEIDAAFAKIAKNSRIADGHSDQMNLLAAGQFGVTLSSFVHHTVEAGEDGAPVQWRGEDGHAVQPIIMRYEAVALAERAPHPAAATLFMDFVLGEEGAAHIESERTVPAVPGDHDPLEGLNVVLLDSEEYATNGAQWAKEYDQLLRNAKK